MSYEKRRKKKRSKNRKWFITAGAGLLIVILCGLILKRPGSGTAVPSTLYADGETVSESTSAEVPETTEEEKIRLPYAAEPPQLDSEYHKYTMGNFGNGWYHDEAENGWRYRSENGDYAPGGWEWIDTDGDQTAECFYFDEYGLLAGGTVVDGYSVDEKGRWVENGKIKTLELTSLNGWYRWDAMDSCFINGWKYRDWITPDNIYCNKHGQRILTSNIDPELMRERSMGTTYIAVEKSTHFLEVWENGEKTHVYVITTGGEDGDKEVLGDRKTPEGEFVICEKVPDSKYTRGLYMNYPTDEDAERGYVAGLISKGEYTAILEANRNGTRPPSGTALGGMIEIHGARDDENNSSGCIELRNWEMEELYQLIPAGTGMVVYP